jgi:hypothetical protein
MSKESVFDEAIKSVNDIGTNVKFDDAVKIADKTFNDLSKAKLNFSGGKINGCYRRRNN